MAERSIRLAKKKYVPYCIVLSICGVKREMRKFHNQLLAEATA